MFVEGPDVRNKSTDSQDLLSLKPINPKPLHCERLELTYNHQRQDAALVRRLELSHKLGEGGSTELMPQYPVYPSKPSSSRWVGPKGRRGLESRV